MTGRVTTPPPGQESALPRQAAVELAAAFVQEIATIAGIRVLFVKGVVAVAQALRSPRESADVDVLVDPAGFTELVAALTDRGWRARYTSDDEFRAFPQHSVTLVHPHWPCDLDLHYFFVGTFRDPQISFDELWVGHTQVKIAERLITAPDPSRHRMILAINAVRDRGRPSADLEAEQLADQFRDSPGSWETVCSVGSVTRSLSVLREFAQDHHLAAPPPDLNRKEQKQLQFLLRYHGSGVGDLGYRLSDPSLPITHRLKVLSLLAFKPPSRLRLERPGFGGGAFAALQVNAGRWAKGIAQVLHVHSRSPRRRTAVPAEAASGPAFSFTAPNDGVPLARLRATRAGIVFESAHAAQEPVLNDDRTGGCPGDAVLGLCAHARASGDTTSYLLSLDRTSLTRFSDRTPPVVALDANGQEIIALIDSEDLTVSDLAKTIARRHDLDASAVDAPIHEFVARLGAARLLPDRDEESGLADSLEDSA